MAGRQALRTCPETIAVVVRGESAVAFPVCLVCRCIVTSACQGELGPSLSPGSPTQWMFRGTASAFVPLGVMAGGIRSQAREWMPASTVS